MRMALAAMVVALACGGVRAEAQGAPKADAWSSYRFLIGTWTGEGTGQPGTGAGTATFRMDQDDRVMVRTAKTDYPATAQRPAFSHTDLMVIYRDAPGQPVRAIYWDNEDHTIEYDVSASADGKTVTFVTKAVPSAPRFRLVYTNLGPTTVDVKFEIAPPGSPDAFKVYTQGVTRKVQ